MFLYRENKWNKIGSYYDEYVFGNTINPYGGTFTFHVICHQECGLVVTPMNKAMSTRAI